MTNYYPTPEQLAVIHHPRGKHARVLAVAGSGKTTTMVYRVQELVLRQNVNPHAIQILMFNRLARIQFGEKLTEIGIPQEYQPPVNTFHSFANQVISDAITLGLLPGLMDIWVGDKSELVRQYVHRAAKNLLDRQVIFSEPDVDEVLEAIQLWKSSLVPPLPERAGHRGNNDIPRIYAEFENLRFTRNGLTYDDFVPLAIGIIEQEEPARRRWCGSLDYVIVDEYQDVNYGQQRLIELLAGKRADVMVVGDDDQTIYEWRGARPNYILSEFERVFDNKPHVSYTLSRSFRFGPVIAQCAHNVITFNSNRLLKSLVAHDVGKTATVRLTINDSEQSTDANKELAQTIVALVRETGDPRSVIVLGRLFVQLAGLEVECLARRIPYRVLGRAPFFERREICVLLDYLRVAADFDQPVSQRLANSLLSIANVPNRKLNKEMLRKGIEMGMTNHMSTRQVLRWLIENVATTLSRPQREQARMLRDVIDRLNERMKTEQHLLAGHLLLWLVDLLDLPKHYDDYYGQGEHSEERKKTVSFFCDFARRTGLQTIQFLHYVERLDTTLGQPEEKQIVMTTVYRTKGAEYDYVIIPNCEEGNMPCIYANANLVYDKAGIVKEPIVSEVVDNERRLFYVAVTRAKKGVFIGASTAPTRGSQSKSTPSLPSRFLDEIQLEPTAALFGSLQQYVAGDPFADDRLIESTKEYGGHKGLVNDLLGSYSSDIGNEYLETRLSEIASRLPPEPLVRRWGTAKEPITVAETKVVPNWWDE